MTKTHRIAATFQATFYIQFGRKQPQQMTAMRKLTYAQLISNVPTMGGKLLVTIQATNHTAQLIIADKTRLDQATKRRLSLQKIEDWAKEGTVRIQCRLLHSL